MSPFRAHPSLRIYSRLMGTEAGEFIVGAYLQHFCDCSVVLYNSRMPGGGLPGLPELDVIGLDLKQEVAYLCEVTTHLHGMRPQAVKKCVTKHQQQRQYAEAMLDGYTTHFQLWSPKVFPGQIIQLNKVGFELIVNGEFKKRVDRLRTLAKSIKHDTGNPFMRTIQILEHLKD
jgi:hypothetical protein